MRDNRGWSLSSETAVCKTCSDKKFVLKRDPTDEHKSLTVPCPRCGVQHIEKGLQSMYPLPRDWSKLTLDSIPAVKGEERALAHSKHVAERGRGWLCLQGEYGVGKTLMLAGVMNAIQSRGLSAVFLTGSTISALVYRALQPDSEFNLQGIERQLRYVHLLCIDELDKAGLNSPFAFDQFFNVLNWRYEQATLGDGGMTAIAFNDASQVHPAIYSRMNDGSFGDGQMGGIIKITAQDQRPRKAAK